MKNNNRFSIVLGICFAVAYFFLSISLKAQSVFDYKGITYRVLKDADEASTFGTVAVTVKSDGFYEGTVVIPNAVKSSDDAFADTYKVVAIDDFAFKSSPNLLKVKLPISVESIGKNAFEECLELECVDIPYGTFTSFGESAFAMSGLKRIRIPEGVTEIPVCAFKECRELKEVILPNTLQKIGICAFMQCQSLDVVVLPVKLREIELGAFTYCGLKSIKLPDKVISIPTDAFRGCFDLDEVYLSPYTISIASNAFSECGHLSIHGPQNIKIIDDAAFINCWDIPEQYQTPGYNRLLEYMGIEKMQEQIDRFKNSFWK